MSTNKQHTLSETPHSNLIERERERERERALSGTIYNGGEKERKGLNDLNLKNKHSTNTAVINTHIIRVRECKFSSPESPSKSLLPRTGARHADGRLGGLWNRHCLEEDKSGSWPRWFYSKLNRNKPNKTDGKTYLHGKYISPTKVKFAS